MKLHESETLEIKSSLSHLDEIIETAAALANTRGGKILVGVTSGGKVIGIEVGKDTLERIVNKIKQHTDPALYPAVRIKMVEGKKILEVTVKESKEKPVLAFGRAFKRVGKSTVRIDKYEHEQMVVERKKVYFDSLRCTGATMKDIDEEKVRGFLQKAREERRLGFRAGISVKETLEKLHLFKNNWLTTAAILLFGRNPQQYFSSAEVRCARFKGTEPLNFIDMKVFSGDLLQQRQEALEFIQKHIQLQAKIVRTERVEQWEYPLEALREAVTNALAHRNYEIASTIQVRIFDDRLEVWSPGKLPAGITVEKLRQKHESILRNPLIGKTFFLLKYIEQWGTGTNRIIHECREQGLPEPRFEQTDTSFIVTFQKSRFTEELLNQLGLNDRQKRAIEHLKIKGKITNGEYAKMNTVGRVYAFKELAALVEKRVIKPVGKGRALKYVLVSG